MSRLDSLDGEAAVPRKNGELVFKAPWEGRVFGMAVALNETGAYPWDDFRSQLVQKIASEPGESLLLESGVVSAQELERRAAEYRSLERDPVF